MIKKIFIPAFLLVVFISCKKDSSELMTANASAQASGHVLPFGGSFTTVNTILVLPPNMEQSVVGTGTATFLGSCTFVAMTNVTVSGTPPFAVNGTKTFTAANGDQLFTSFTGTSGPVAPNVTQANLHEVITGGTGRFENASGSFETTAIADQVTPSFTADLKGTIKLK